MKTLHLSVALVTLALSASLPAHLFAGAINAAVHLFTPKRGVWTETANFIASDGTADDLLGASLAVSQDTFLAGAPFSDTSGVFNGGAAYYFQLPSR